jgi:hypothetical protein
MAFPKALLWSLLIVMGAASATAGEPEVVFDYATSRQIFRDLANEIKSNPNYGSPDKGPFLEGLPIRYPEVGDDDLTIDALVIPARTKKSLVVQINSGIHGLEAPSGSYLQQHFLSKCLPSLPKDLLDETTFVIAHALNPWGFKNANRFNANNVDLNRNCGGARPNGAFAQCDGGASNEEYEVVKDVFDTLVRQDGPINLPLCRVAISVVAGYRGIFAGGPAAIFRVATRGELFMERALRGQIQNDKGIYFAGEKLQPECKAYQDFSKQFYEGERRHRHSLTITWHTGYGATGHLQFMADPSDKSDSKLVCLLGEKVFAPDKLRHIDFEPTFKTCNDENVWLRRVKPERHPNVGTDTNAYLTAEIGGQGGLDSICAVLMAQQLKLKQQTGMPRFKDAHEEREFRDRIFYVFNPVNDDIETEEGSKTYIEILDDHAEYSCKAIEKYMRAVLQKELD